MGERIQRQGRAPSGADDPHNSACLLGAFRSRVHAGNSATNRLAATRPLSKSSLAAALAALDRKPAGDAQSAKRSVNPTPEIRAKRPPRVRKPAGRLRGATDPKVRGFCFVSARAHSRLRRAFEASVSVPNSRDVRSLRRNRAKLRCLGSRAETSCAAKPKRCVDGYKSARAGRCIRTREPARSAAFMSRIGPLEGSRGLTAQRLACALSPFGSAAKADSLRNSRRR